MTSRYDIGKRVSDFLRARCFAVAVQPSGDLSRLAEGERKAVQKHMSFAGNLQIETQILEGEDLLRCSSILRVSIRSLRYSSHVLKAVPGRWPDLAIQYND